MAKNCNNLLYHKVSEKNIKPRHVAEVGVWHPETSNIFQFIKENIQTTLVEPDPESIKLIKSEFGNNKAVSLYEVALCDFNGKVELFKRESSTFICNLSSSPALVNDNADLTNTDRFTAEAKLFNEIDDGSIDLISIDTEGSEWFVIKHMISRPTIISIETHGGMYVNPYLKELLHWMQENSYILWYKDKSDSVFVIKETITVSLLDKINLILINIFITFKANKKKLSQYKKAAFKKN